MQLFDVYKLYYAIFNAIQNSITKSKMVSYSLGFLDKSNKNHPYFPDLERSIQEDDLCQTIAAF